MNPTVHASLAQFTRVGGESTTITTISKTWKRGEVCTTGDNADPRTRLRPHPTKATPMLKSYGPADGAIASHGNINSFTQDNTPICFLASTTYLLKSSRLNPHHTQQWQRESSRSAAPEYFHLVSSCPSMTPRSAFATRESSTLFTFTNPNTMRQQHHMARRSHP